MSRTLSKRTAVAALAIATAAALLIAPATSQTASEENAHAAQPQQPIHLVLGFPAGTAVDAVARLIQEPLARELARPIVIEYKTGAAGNIASEHVARAQPDGNTLLFGTAATHGSNAALYPKLPFDVQRDFTPIAPLVDMSNVLAINPKVVNARDLQDFIAQVRANPGKYNYSSSGNGTGLHMAFADFNHRLGLEMVHVPYKGGAEALAAMLRGEVCCVMAQVQAVQPYLQTQNESTPPVRLLGVTTATAVSALPTLQPLAHSGQAELQGFDLGIWFGIFAPRGLPDEQRDGLNRAIQKVLSLPELKNRIEKMGNTVRLENAAQFQKTVHDNRQKWEKIVKNIGVKID